MVTPFNEDGSVDYDALVRLVEFQIQNGTDFLCVLGTTAETPTLTADEKKKICSSTDIYDIMLPEMKELPHEEFWVIILNRSNRIIEKRMISKGGISATVADIRLILRAAILAYGSGIIVCHNHPSGNMQPSAEDNKLTMKIKNAAAQMDMALLDHIIITEHGYYSYADEGAL